MKININGVTREMGSEEIAEMEARAADVPVMQPTPEERIAQLEEALEMLLSGEVE